MPQIANGLLFGKTGQNKVLCVTDEVINLPPQNLEVIYHRLRNANFDRDLLLNVLDVLTGYEADADPELPAESVVSEKPMSSQVKKSETNTEQPSETAKKPSEESPEDPDKASPFEKVKLALRAVINADKNQAALLLEQFGISKISELPETQYADFMKEAKNAITA